MSDDTVAVNADDLRAVLNSHDQWSNAAPAPGVNPVFDRLRAALPTPEPDDPHDEAVERACRVWYTSEKREYPRDSAIETWDGCSDRWEFQTRHRRIIADVLREYDRWQAEQGQTYDDGYDQGYQEAIDAVEMGTEDACPTCRNEAPSFRQPTEDDYEALKKSYLYAPNDWAKRFDAILAVAAKRGLVPTPEPRSPLTEAEDGLDRQLQGYQDGWNDAVRGREPRPGTWGCTLLNPTPEPLPPVTEDILRQALTSDGIILGDWAEWTEAPLGGYNALTVTARQTLAHLHGQHDDTTDPYAHCVMCTVFRVLTHQSDGGDADDREASEPKHPGVATSPPSPTVDPSTPLTDFVRACADEGVAVQPFMLRRLADELDGRPTVGADYTDESVAEMCRQARYDGYEDGRRDAEPQVVVAPLPTVKEVREHLTDFRPYYYVRGVEAVLDAVRALMPEAGELVEVDNGYAWCSDCGRLCSDFTGDFHDGHDANSLYRIKREGES